MYNNDGEMMVVTNHDKMIQCKDTLIQMLIRLFPFNRGLFEDKVKIYGVVLIQF